MPRAYSMTPDFGGSGRTARWKKRFKGITYTVTCAELGLPEADWSVLGSYQKANEWWAAKVVSMARDFGYLKASVDRLEADANTIIDDGTKQVVSLNAALAGLAKAVELIEREPRNAVAVMPTVDLVIDAATNPKTIPEDRKIGACLDRWFSLLYTRIAATSVPNIRAYVRLYKEMLGTEADVGTINANVIEKAYLHLNKMPGAMGTKKKIWMFFKSFVSWLGENELIDLPRNLQSKRYRFSVVKTQKEEPNAKAIKEFLGQLPDRLRLYALLALNVSANNVDIGKLAHYQIDWKRKTLTRKRVKTIGVERVPTVKYGLWPETFALLCLLRSKDAELVLVDANGEPLYIDKKTVGEDGKETATVYDKIKSQWRDWFGKGRGKK